MSGFDNFWTQLINPQLEALDLEAGLLRLCHQPDERTLNHNGDVVAGALFSLAEMAGMGLAVMLLGADAARFLVVVKSAEIRFKARARGAIVAEASLPAEQMAAMQAQLANGQTARAQVPVVLRNADGECVVEARMEAVIKPR